MPLKLPIGRPTLLIRRSAFEQAGLTRSAIDLRLNLTSEEFRVEGGLICIGPIHDDEALGALLVDLETVGLNAFEDFMDLNGAWPEWLTLFAMAEADPSANETDAAGA
jgi:hypothetical protein